MTRTALYRFYDQNDVLQYVGITQDVETRWNNHAKKRWWPEVARKTVEWHEERSEAEAAEKAAIISEKPLYNVVHSTTRAERERRSAPSAPFYDRVMSELDSQQRLVPWLAEKASIDERIIGGWRKEGCAPNAVHVMAVADALGICRNEAAGLSGLPDNDWPELTASQIELRTMSDMRLLMESAKRLLSLDSEIEVAIQFMRFAKQR